MKNATKESLEDIFPLGFSERALLLHRLYEREDQGITQASMIIHGSIDEVLFAKAWSETINRHPALRSSIHWENVKFPVRVVKKRVQPTILYEDWSETSSEVSPHKFANYREKDKQEALDLTKAPIFRLSLIKLSEDKFGFVWTSHHILYDGWSARIVLRDFMEIYAALIEGRKPNLPLLPSHKQYLQWLRRQDRQVAKDFWVTQIDPAAANSIFRPHSQSSRKNVNTGGRHKLTTQLSSDDTDRIKSYCQQNKLTLSSLLRGVYGILLAAYFQTDKVVFGTTASGRSSVELPEVESMVGLFTNVIPVKAAIPTQSSFSEWLVELQRDSLEATKFDYINLEEITNWINGDNHQPLLNSLLVIQNAGDKLDNFAGWRISEERGEPITAYPLLLNVLPGGNLTFELYFQESHVPTSLAEWFMTSLTEVLGAIVANNEENVEGLRRSIQPAPIAPEISLSVKRESYHDVAAPSNPTELALNEIWEDLLGIRPISINDDFFALGGTSLLAIKLFSRIESRFDKRLPPITLVEHRTIADLAPLINENIEVGWTSLIPFRTSGKNHPIFCFHGGDGYVFFYQRLAQLLDDRPVYAIQPQGLDGTSSFHDSIESMAAFYLAEIKKAFPEGPYIFISYCFSNAICLEIGKQLNELGEPTPELIIMDSAPSRDSSGKIIHRNRVNKSWKYIAWHLSRLNLKTAWEEVAVRYLPESFGDANFKDRRRVRRLRQKLHPLTDRYVWPELNGDALHIRSGSSSKDPHVKTWKQLVNGQLTAIKIECSHHELFHDPIVSTVAEEIEKYLEEKINN